MNRQSRLVLLLAAAGFVGALAISPIRAWLALLTGSYLLLGASLSGTFIVALLYASGAAWAVAVRRVPESMSAALPLGAAGLLTVFLAYPWIYPWSHHAFEGFKGVWLSRPAFLLRAAVYIGLWIWFSHRLVRNSRCEDREPNGEYRARNVRWSVAFLPVFAVTFWLSSVDWLMSLEPEWYSTVFAVYNFAGLLTSGLALTIVLTIRMAGRGALRDFVTPEHYHDLGKLLFGFSTFWMYIWFCQYMLIWYANIPEETVYYAIRLQGLWLPLFLINVLLNWLIPFFALLPVSTKRNPRTLGRVAVVVLAGRALDVYLMAAPGVVGPKPLVGVPEIVILAGAAAVFWMAFERAFQKAEPAPVNDPWLEASLHYHN